jgi:hypothetical protein
MNGFVSIALWPENDSVFLLVEFEFYGVTVFDGKRQRDL